MNEFIGFQVSGDGKPSPVSTLVKIETSPSKGIQMLFVRKGPAMFGYSIGLVRVGYGLQSIPRPTSHGMFMIRASLNMCMLDAFSHPSPSSCSFTNILVHMCQAPGTV